MKINYHVHTTGSDGKLSPEQVIENAIKTGITHLCLTDHYPAPEGVDLDSLKHYREGLFEDLTKLKEKNKDKIDISIGAEFDWAEGFDSWYKTEITKKKYDYLIGSVHRVINEKENFGLWDGKETVENFVKRIGPKKYTERYYEMVRSLINSKLFDCVGHFDIIKIHNLENPIFSEKDSWYIKAVENTLDVLAKSKMCVEINMRGMAKQGEDRQYPSFWILQEAHKRKIPITIGNDFHGLNYGNLDQLLDKAYELAKKAGYKSALIFKNRKPIEVEL